MEREVRGKVLDEYLADYEQRSGRISRPEEDRARQIFDEVFAAESQWAATRFASSP